jgi:casein kinase I family protein HRR25
VITGEAVAVKMESIDSKSPKLCHEWKVYKSLGSAVGIPRVVWFGTERGYKAMIMNLLGPSLEDLFTACNRTFSLKTVLMLADQLVSDGPHVLLHTNVFIYFLTCRSPALNMSMITTMSIVTSNPTTFS